MGDAIPHQQNTVTPHPQGLPAAAVDLGTKDVEKYLSLGLVAIMDMEPADEESVRYDGQIVGWRPHSFIVWQTRVDPKKPWRIVHDEESVLRFFAQGRACGVKTFLMDWHVRGNQRIVYLSWPDELRYRIVRKQNRLDTELLCEAVLESKDELWGTVRQLSEGGIRVYLPMKNTKDKPQSVSFELPNGVPVDNLKLEVKHAVPGDKGIYFGCQFDASKLKPAIQSALRYYVETSLTLLGRQCETNRPGIILSPQTKVFEEAVRKIRHQGLDATATTSLIECFALLQTLGAGAIYVDATFETLATEEVVRLIRKSNCFPRVPVFVFGSITDEVRARVEELGGKCLESLDASDASIDVVAAVLRKADRV